MLKIDIINGAYSRCRISGLTSNPTPSDLNLALGRLEDMAAMWESKNIGIGYNFEDSPNPNSLTNLPRSASSAFQANLAILLLADFGKEAHPALVQEANGTLSALMGSTAKVTPVQYSARQPIGSGNIRWNRTQRFYQPAEQSPNAAATNIMLVGDVNDFVEHFDSYLIATETIASYVISANSTNITISNDSLTSPYVFYRVTAVQVGAYQVKIVATTSLGRVETRIIYFTVNEA
ncbi:MAG: hypothetical protein HGA87_00960 [Desulfobulbaceae bacterium]|nr:hypothetical protein [Desulfobulbaceae bacterium]